MQSIISALIFPFLILNSVGWIIGIIWLIFLGQWGSIGLTLFFVILGPLGYGFILMPVALIMLGGSNLYERGGLIRIASYPLILIGYLSTFIFMTISAIAIFYGFYKKSDAISLIPMMLAAYGAATSPWISIAQKEYKAGNHLSIITAMFLSLSSAVAFVFLVFTSISIFSAVGIIVVTMSIVCLVQLFFIINERLKTIN